MALSSLIDRGFNREGLGGGPVGAVWGSPQWNATNDPQHARDLAYLGSSAYAGDLNRVNPGLVGQGYYFHYDPNDPRGTSLRSSTEGQSNWARLYRPGLEFYGALAGGAAAGSALGAGAEAGGAGGAAGEAGTAG